MVRCFLTCSALFVCLCCLPGCDSGGGGDATFSGAPAQTESEIQEAEDYDAMMKAQDAANYAKTPAAPAKTPAATPAAAPAKTPAPAE